MYVLHSFIHWRNLFLILLWMGYLPTQLLAQTKPENLLLGRAVLDAATFATGPTSGQYIGEGTINGQQVPFEYKQPVQGFSAVLPIDKDSFWAMSDNGFGGIENSSDYHLRVYKIEPRFKTKKGGRGDMVVKRFIELHDPDKHIPFAITNHFSEERILTGADFDIESFQMAKDGTLWFGDEFGPFLIHTDAEGKVLEAPISLPDFDNPGKEIRAPQNPYNEEGSALRIMNAMRSHAFLYGSKKTPVIAPWSVMLADGNPATFSGDRESPPSGLAPASSEIFNVSSLQSAGYPVVVWTVNDQPYMEGLIDLGVDGIISDSPDLLWAAASQYDGDGNGQPDFLDADGLIDINLFDAQGHRGGRNLRPENTLPAMEAALDYLMTTLETDCGITKDGIPVLDHDPHIESAKVRKADGTPYEYEDEVLIKDHTLAEIQSMFIADKLLAGRPDQTNDRSLSPVSVAFAAAYGLMDPYVMPSLQQLFDFVKFYAEYYKTGDGSVHPQAEKRWKNAERVRFNIETKINPRTDADNRGDIFADRTVAAEPFAKAVANVIMDNEMYDRADIQSFDFRTLLIVHKYFPDIRTAYLFGDFPKVGDAGDGTNLQDQNGANTPWLGGLFWPYRVTSLDHPMRAQSSGGFEGMALSHDKKMLLPLLEKPLIGGDPGALLIHPFDIDTKQYTGSRFMYNLEPEGAAIGDFIMFSDNRGLIIERDGSQGNLDGFKAVYEIEIKGYNQPVGKRLAVDLLNIWDKKGISNGLPGDVGIGERFAFPFVTIESVVVFNRRQIGILNDNNYPFSIGRHVGDGLPDDNEFIIIKLDQKLGKEPIEEKPVFILVNAHNNQDIMPLKDGDQIVLSELPTEYPNIRAEIEGENVESVVFTLNGHKVRTENEAPYAIAGDKEGDYHKRTFPLGKHTVTATPYSEDGGEGDAGMTYEVSFEILEGTPAAKFAYETEAQKTVISPDKTMSVFPNPFEDRVKLAVLPSVGDKLTLQLTDVYGRVVYKEERSLTNTGEITELNLAGMNLKRGLYILQVRGEGVDGQTFRLFKD